jgi:N-acetylglucosamine kinase-like BadF-type ATPase
MKTFIGIDGGGTKTKVIAIDENMNIVFESVAGPTSIDTVPEKTTYRNLKSAFKDFDYESHDIRGIFAGLGGIVFDQDEKKVENIIRDVINSEQEILIKAKNDMVTALFSGLSYEKGMSMICGTGMVVYGVNNSKNHKAGGWGHREGELGSAFHLGKELIMHTVRAFDGRKDLDDLARDCAKDIGLKETADIINIMNEIFDSRTTIASLAPIVTKHANLGNSEAKKICDSATEELALAVRAVYKKLDFDEVTLVIVGSLGNSSGYFQETLHQKIMKISNKIQIIAPMIDPAEAAARMALRICTQGEKNPPKMIS